MPLLSKLMNRSLLVRPNLTHLKHLISKLEHLAPPILFPETLKAVWQGPDRDCFGVFNHKGRAIDRTHRRNTPSPRTHRQVYVRALSSELGIVDDGRIAVAYTTQIKQLIAQLNFTILHGRVNLLLPPSRKAVLTVAPMFKPEDISSEQGLEAIRFRNSWQSRHNEFHAPTLR